VVAGFRVRCALAVSASLLARSALAATGDPAAVSETPPPAAESSVVAESTDAARKAAAEERRQRALQFFDAGDYRAARSEFESANRLMPSFRLLYNLGVVSMALADAASAYDFFQRYLAEGNGAIAPEVRDEVTRRLQDLAAQVASVVLVVDSAGAEVFIDDQSVGTAPFTTPIHVNVGSHQVVARLPGAHSNTQRLELLGAETVRVQLVFSAPPIKPARPATPVFWAGWVSTAALATGAAFSGFEALAAQRNYQQQFATFTSGPERDRLNARANHWSIAADTLTGAAVVVGIYSLYVTLKHPSAQKLSTQAAKKIAVRLGVSSARVAVTF
jgi:hypothetical protein